MKKSRSRPLWRSCSSTPTSSRSRCRRTPTPGCCWRSCTSCSWRAKTTTPVFYQDFPKNNAPLTRLHRDDDRLTEKWDLVCWGAEQGTGYSELIDPLDQRDRFVEQAKRAGRGDDEAMRLDEDFLRALGVRHAAGGWPGHGHRSAHHESHRASVSATRFCSPWSSRSSAVTGPQIREARTSDVRVIRRLMDEYAADRILLQKATVTLFEDVQEFYVAEIDGEIVGCGALHVLWEDLGEVRTLAVDKRASRQGHR